MKLKNPNTIIFIIAGVVIVVVIVVIVIPKKTTYQTYTGSASPAAILAGGSQINKPLADDPSMVHLKLFS